MDDPILVNRVDISIKDLKPSWFTEACELNPCAEQCILFLFLSSTTAIAENDFEYTWKINVISMSAPKTTHVLALSQYCPFVYTLKYLFP